MYISKHLETYIHIYIYSSAYMAYTCIHTSTQSKCLAKALSWQDRTLRNAFSGTKTLRYILLPGDFTYLNPNST